MFVLPLNWAVAARFSGRFDPWPVLERLGGPEAFSEASVSALVAAGLPLPVAAALEGGAALDTAVPFVLAGSAAYPSALRHVAFAPPVLFYRGDPCVLKGTAVAVVGTRRCTAYGRRISRQISRGVCVAGGVVVSGLAIGIDTAAHEGAMETGRTVAVLGHGLEAEWRPGAMHLGERIIRGGGVVLSEFLPTWPADKFTFPQRNRVIAGLAVATVVVEAGHRSGALSTARQALAAGREVLAVPGPILEGCSEGCLDLIERGATPVRGVGTVLASANLARAGGEGSSALPGVARGLRDLLALGSTLDQIVAASGLSVVEALRVLTQLELGGIVRREPGQRFVLRG